MSDSLVNRLNAHKPYNAFTDGKLVPEAAARIIILEAENARLRNALKPFGDAAKLITANWKDYENHWIGIDLNVTIGDFRRAREALGD